jgi:hypothetical protein
MTDLSPAAQAVLDGFRAVPNLMDAPSIAGALRAAADQVAPLSTNRRQDDIRQKLLSIAAELEAKALPGPVPRDPGCDKTSAFIDQ